MPQPLPLFDDQQILDARPPKNRVSPEIPYAFLNETEHAADGTLAEVSTIFLTNRECPFRCLMCDLWKNTLDETLAPGQIPRQIEYALSRLPPARQIKLYNSGNFFDAKAIPPADLPRIATLTQAFERVIVENHPLLCQPICAEFQKMLSGELEVALGLETANAAVLKTLNKRMTLDDFSRAVDFLRSHSIAVRAFILLKPPFLEEAAAMEGALRSLEFAFARGVECCSIIPTRSGNGMLEQLEHAGQFAPPLLSSVESTLEAGLRLNQGRVLMDLWDLNRLYQNEPQLSERLARLQRMNLTQQVVPGITPTD